MPLLEDIYNHNPRTTTLVSMGLSALGASLIALGMLKKKNSKTFIGLGLASGLISEIVFYGNRPVGIAGKNPEDVITWLKLEGFTNIPEEEIRKTGHYFWKK